MRLKDGVRVLDRGDGAIAVGLHPGVILRGLDDAARRAVELLEGPGHPGPLPQDILLALESAGLLAIDEPPLPRALITDAGPLGLAIATVMSRGGWPLRVWDEGSAAGAPRGTYLGGLVEGTRQWAAARDLAGADICIGAGASEIAVAVGHGAVDPAIWQPLLSADIPHLLVVADESGVDIGPLVIAGRGACAGCGALVRADADPAWPVLALQLAATRGATPRVSAAVASLAAGVVATVLDAWARDASSAPVSLIWRVEGLGVTERECAPHVWCGCGAAGPIGDQLGARRAAWHWSDS